MGMGGGGGGASGRTDFPDYMKAYHSSLLWGTTDSTRGGIPFNVSVAEALNFASRGDSPYFAYTKNQVDPNTLFFSSGKLITDSAYAKPFDLLARLTTIVPEDLINSAQHLPSNTTWINSMIAAQTATLDDEIALGVSPKFHANMRDIGSVMSSAFAIGDVLIQDSKLKALAKTRLEVEALSMQREELAIKYAQTLMIMKQSTASISLDFVKLYHAIKAEADDTNAEWVAKDLLWDLKLFQYAANPLGSISGSALSVDHGKGSKTGSAVGGALVGAASGAYVGSEIAPGYGTAIGAVVGGVAGLAGGLFS